MSKYDQSVLETKFNPSGNDYDTQTALDAGLSANNENHWQSIDPRTGMILKGKNHETWDSMVDEEEKLGNVVVKGDDGRYYSVKGNRYTSSVPVLDEDSQDTYNNFSERAKRDYDFAIENNVEFGFGDAIRKEWGTQSGLTKKIPFVGGIIGLKENLKMISAAKRIQDPNRYKQEWNLFVLSSGAADVNDESALYGIDKIKWEEDFKARDKKMVKDYLKYITSDKTIMAKITSGASQLPTWFVEFAATGGLASLGDNAVQKAGEKIFSLYAKKATGKIAIRASSIVAGGITRSVGLSHRITEGTTQRQLDTVLGLKEQEGWAMSALISWGDVAIEAISESAGDDITKGVGFILNKTKFGSKVASGLEKAWITATGGNKGEFIRKMSSKGGYSNILAEIGEERLGTILRAITNVDDFGAGKDANMIERIQYGIIQDYENIGVELGVLAVPFAGQSIIGGVANFGKPEDYFTDEFGNVQDTISPEPSPDVIADIAEEAPKPPTSVKLPVDAAVEPIVDTEISTKPVADTQTLTEQPQPEKPVVIKDGNTTQDMDSITKTIITGNAEPQKTSARQDDLQEDRAALGLDGVASAERKGWQISLDEAYGQGIPDNALRIASEINDTPRPLNDTETAGLVIKGARLKNEHKSIMAKIATKTDEAEIASLSAQLARIEGEFDSLSSALYKSGTEKGRALVSQKLTINQEFDLLSLKNRAVARKGRPLTEKETKKVEQLSKDLELQEAQNLALQKRVAELEAKTEIKRGSITRYSNMSRQQINFELDSLVAETKQLLEEGCYN